MPTLYREASVCGATSTMVDGYEWDYLRNIGGYRCCGYCDTITEARIAWAMYYGYDPASL